MISSKGQIQVANAGTGHIRVYYATNMHTRVLYALAGAGQYSHSHTISIYTQAHTGALSPRGG